MTPGTREPIKEDELRMPRRPGATLATSVCLLVAAAGAPAANAAWNQPVGGPSPVNHAKDESNLGARMPSLTVIGGVPWVAWQEFGGNGFSQIRVSRLAASGTAWEEVVGGASPINRVSTRNAHSPSLTSMGGVPYVAWEEGGAIFVSRLNAAGTAWEAVGGPGAVASGHGPSLVPVAGVLHVAANGPGGTQVRRLSAAGTAWEPVGGGSTQTRPGTPNFYDATLASIDGVPWVAWVVEDGNNFELVVTRLNSAGTGWEEVATAQSPINHSPDGEAYDPQIASVGGIPYVVWAEHKFDHGFEIRVSRLNAGATPAWEEVGAGESPINHASGQDGFNPTITDIGGVPYIAWTEVEQDDDNRELRVSRLGTDGKSWHEVVGGASPLNNASNREANFPSLTSVGGVPYVAWDEPDDDDREIRVSRLEPEFLQQSVLTNDGEALLLSRVRTYGVAYPVAVQYGPGAQLGQQTAVARTAFDVHEDTWFQTLGELAPGTAYSWRPVGFDGTRTTGAGATQSFTTEPAPGSGPPGPAGPAGPPGQPRLLVAVLQPKLSAISGRSVSVHYIATAAAAVTLEVRRCGGGTVARIAAAARAGRNKVRWNGRTGRTRARPGCYILAVRAASSDGQAASDRAKLRVTRRSVR